MEVRILWIYKLGTGLACDHTFSNYWQVVPDQGVTPKNKGKGIRTTLPLPATNSDFGAANGTVQVEVDGTYACFPDSRVFFDKDATTNPDGTVPNWFYYWRQIPEISNLLSIPGIALWKPYDPNNPSDPNNCSFIAPSANFTLQLKYAGYPYSTTPGTSITYGNQNFGVLNMKREEIVADPLNPNSPHNCGYAISNSDRVVTSYGQGVGVIDIGQGCGFRKQLKDGSSVEGVYAFYSTVVHEVEHALIDCQLWAGGYTTADDSDLDGYPNIWESTLQNGIMFNPNPTFMAPYDAYGVNKNNGMPEAYDSNLLGMGLYSAGTEYEEARCRDKEVQMKSNYSKLDNYDWSFNDGNTFGEINQGKQW